MCQRLMYMNSLNIEVLDLRHEHRCFISVFIFCHYSKYHISMINFKRPMNSTENDVPTIYCHHHVRKNAIIIDVLLHSQLNDINTMTKYTGLLYPIPLMAYTVCDFRTNKSYLFLTVLRKFCLIWHHESITCSIPLSCQVPVPLYVPMQMH